MYEQEYERGTKMPFDIGVSRAGDAYDFTVGDSADIAFVKLVDRFLWLCELGGIKNVSFDDYAIVLNVCQDVYDSSDKPIDKSDKV